MGHCCSSRDDLISDEPLHMDEQRQDDQLESTYTNSVPEAIYDKEGWRERVRDIRADSAS